MYFQYNYDKANISLFLLRFKLELNTKDFAEALSYSPSTISRFENWKSKYTSTLRNYLADTFSIDIEEDNEYVYNVHHIYNKIFVHFEKMELHDAMELFENIKVRAILLTESHLDYELINILVQIFKGKTSTKLIEELEKRLESNILDSREFIKMIKVFSFNKRKYFYYKHIYEVESINISELYFGISLFNDSLRAYRQLRLRDSYKLFKTTIQFYKRYKC